MRKDCFTQYGEWESRSHDDLDGWHDLAGFYTEGAEPKDAVTGSIDERLNESPGFEKGLGQQYPGDRNFCQTIGNAAFCGLALVQTDPREFGVCIQAKGHLPAGGDPIA